VVKACFRIIAHGKESGPWGEKMTALAEVARKRGHIESQFERGDSVTGQAV